MKIKLEDTTTKKLGGYSIAADVVDSFDEWVKKKRTKPGKLLEAILRAGLHELTLEEKREADAAKDNDNKPPPAPPGSVTHLPTGTES